MRKTNLPHSHGQAMEAEIDRIPCTEDFETVSILFKQLSDASRVRIFWLLCHCEECVINISAFMNMSSPAVAHHLKLLRAQGLIDSRRSGKEVYYSAAGTPQAKALHQMIEKLMELSCPGGDA